METISQKRWSQLARASFDRYVNKRMVDGNFIVTDDGIDDQDLHNFAKQIDCEPGVLRAAVVNSCSRITKENLWIPISQEKELLVMKAAIKQYLREISISLLNFKREFGREIIEINKNNIGLHTNIDEFKNFIGQLHAEVIAEFYGL